MNIHDAQVMFIGVMIGFFGFMAVDLFLMRRARKGKEKALAELHKAVDDLRDTVRRKR